MNKGIIAILVIVLLLVGGYFIYQSMSQSPTPSTQQTSQNNQNTSPENSGVNVQIKIPKNHEVLYTNSGYGPAELTISAGDTVIFKNLSSGQIWTGSAMHPTHTAYSGTSLQQHCPDTDNNDFDQCKSESSGTSWSFTFTKIGTWGYHNHANSSHFGKIIVE